VYEQKAGALGKGIRLQSLATPLLVPMIEEGYVRGEISRKIIWQYLDNPVLKDIKALILGCTHYPLIRDEIAAYYGGQVDILDSAEIVARALKAYLEYNLLTRRGEKEPDFRCMISDYTTSFEELTTLFFGTRTTLEHFDLWS
jgi:glutamate racemase